MWSILLSPNIRTPPQRPRSIVRERLVRALDDRVRDHRVTLLSAPAGYGKTTLLAQWAHQTATPVAWLTVEPGEGDAEWLLRGLVAAWDAVEPGTRDAPVGLLAGATSPDPMTVVAALVAAASERASPLAFVLDDSHHLVDPGALDTLSILLARMPDTVRFVLSGRGEPALPLARHRAHGDLTELGVPELRLTDDELRTFLTARLPSPLPDDIVASIQLHLEGWFAGAQLVCHAIERRPEGARDGRPGGRNRFIAAFLREDVLASLPDDRRRFLLRTSILDRLCAGLCDAVTGGQDGQAMLEALERDGLFLDALDDGLEWFRYHPLFRDVLHDELRRAHPDELPTLHRRAAAWYRKQAMPDQALAHAVAGGDPELAARIGEDYAIVKMESGELAVVRRWLESIPGDWYEGYPLLSLLRVAFLIYAGEFEESARLLDEVEQRMRRSEARDKTAQLGKVATVRCAIACFQNDIASAEAFAGTALRDLPEDESFYRTSIHHALGDTYSRNGAWSSARQSLRTALGIRHEPSYRIRAVHIFGALADLELRQGHLRQAGDYWSQALDIIPAPDLWGRLPIPVTGWVSIRTGELLYERNRRDESRGHLQRGLELARLGGDVRSLVAGNLLSARLHLTDGRLETGTSLLEQALSQLEAARFVEWERRAKRLQVEYWLARNQLDPAVAWARALPDAATGDARPDPEIDQLTAARALIAGGDRCDRDRALSILRDVVERSTADGRLGIRIEGMALRALALRDAGDQPGALTALEEALRLAEPHGYVRLFADLGMPMARLLQEARTRRVHPGYCRDILTAIAPGAGSGEDEAASMPEPLSGREAEVLRLIAAGLTNREIGDALFISAETVKKHTRSIYAKLGVGHRTEAVSRGRTVGLLD